MPITQAAHKNLAIAAKHYRDALAQVHADLRSYQALIRKGSMSSSEALEQLDYTLTGLFNHVENYTIIARTLDHIHHTERRNTRVRLQRRDQVTREFQSKDRDQGFIREGETIIATAPGTNIPMEQAQATSRQGPVPEPSPNHLAVHQAKLISDAGRGLDAETRARIVQEAEAALGPKTERAITGLIAKSASPLSRERALEIIRGAASGEDQEDGVPEATSSSGGK